MGLIVVEGPCFRAQQTTHQHKDIFEDEKRDPDAEEQNPQANQETLANR